MSLLFILLLVVVVSIVVMRASNRRRQRMLEEQREEREQAVEKGELGETWRSAWRPFRRPARSLFGGIETRS